MITTKLATFAAGCFWGVEEAFLSSGKIVTTCVGYTGGHTDKPTYKQVCTGTTGHAEAVELVYDPDKVTFRELLGIFWSIHNPTTKNRQGPDVGSQYRSVIFYHDQEQQEEAILSMKEHQKNFQDPIVTEIVSAGPFHPAEEYHQQYVRKTGRNSCGL